MQAGCFIGSLSRCIGQTVTIFTMSSGFSGCYTGVLASVTDSSVKLITAVTHIPSYPANYDSLGWVIARLFGGLLGNGHCYGYPRRRWKFGAVTEILISKIVGFTYNTF
jgi:hypothetical protein